jgi:protein-L-isoaspartate(D-aspartate) O-methyltransferase
MISFELQRRNMVESQVRPSDITDRRVIAAMLAIPREAFVPAATRPLAYMDQDLPVGTSGPRAVRRALLAPRTLARMVQLLEIDTGDRVMEVGTATGYGAAVLGRLAGEVIAVECDTGLAATAKTTLADHNISNIKMLIGPLEAGWPAEAPYNVILVSGAVSDVPAALLDQLQDGGRLVAITTDGGIGRLRLWQRVGTSFAARSVGEASAPPLPGFEQAAGFVF